MGLPGANTKKVEIELNEAEAERLLFNTLGIAELALKLREESKLSAEGIEIAKQEVAIAISMKHLSPHSPGWLKVNW